MTTKSKAALIAALMIGATAVTVAPPAFAKKKDDAPAAAPALKLSPAFQKLALDAQTKLAAKDFAGAETSLATAETTAASDDEKYIAAQLRLNLELGKMKAASANGQIAPAQMVALVPVFNRLIDNPKANKEQVARLLMARGDTYYDGKKYAEAAADYERSRGMFDELDKTPPTDPAAVTERATQRENLSLQIMKAKGEAGDVAGAEAELQARIDAQASQGKKVPDSWYLYVISKLGKAKKTAEAAALWQKLVIAYPTPAYWRNAVGVYAASVTTPLDKRQRLDLQRLLRAAKALADENDYNEYAQATDDLGLYRETLSVVAEGQANGKLPATNPLGKMLKGSSTTGLGLEKPLATQEAQAHAAKTGDLASQVADSYLATGEYSKAAALYREALSKPLEKPTGAATKRHFLDADELNTHLGIALALGGDKDGARAALKSVTSEPRAGIARFWMTWLDAGTTTAS